MATIGSPTEYEALAVNGLTGVVLFRFPWSKITWQRQRNEVSAATVTVAAEDGGIECCRSLNGSLTPWEHLLVIERDGARVWDGPIVGWSRPSIRAGGDRSVTYRALDRFAITMKRLLGLDRLGLADPGELFYNILNDAGIGTLSGSPYVYTLPSSGDFLSKPANQVDASVYVDRLERVYDVVSSLVAQGAITYCQIGDVLWLKDYDARYMLGGVGQRPALNDSTTIDLPGIEVDAMSLATTAYGGALGTGKPGSAIISTQFPFLGAYLSSNLQIGAQMDRASSADPLAQAAGYTQQIDVATEVMAAENATPAFTIEQTQVSCDFGAPLMEADLSNLVPGVLVDIDFDDTCAFNVPYIGVVDEYRFWYERYDGGGVYTDIYSYMPTVVSSPTIKVGRLERIDVSVTAGDDGIEEVFAVSLTPTAEWDELGVGGDWVDPSAPPEEGLFYEV